MEMKKKGNEGAGGKKFGPEIERPIRWIPNGRSERGIGGKSVRICGIQIGQGKRWAKYLVPLKRLPILGLFALVNNAGIVGNVVSFSGREAF